MEKTCGLYLITCTSDTGRCSYYVGQSAWIEKRLGQHRSALRGNRHHNDHMQRAWNKYGADSFSFSILEECQVEKLNERENWWLSRFVGNTCFMNIGTTAEASLRGVKFSQAHKDKIAQAQSGEKHYNYGKHLPEEHRKKISEGGKGLKRNNATRRKISAANAGENNSMFGKTGRQHKNSKPVVGFPVAGGSPIRFESASLAATQGFSPASITTCCKGRELTHYGYIWEYDVGPDTVPKKESYKRFKPIRGNRGRFTKWEPIKTVNDDISMNQSVSPG
ncbi:MAG: hypothetical protein EOM80_19120 [Erysipelotrichia bacterium]|nr:hypothetical protein [Erysipelotrichia bacterium]